MISSPTIRSQDEVQIKTNRNLFYLCSDWPLLWHLVNPLTLKIWLLILPFSWFTSPCESVVRICSRSRWQLLPGKFEFSQCLFAGYCMNTMGRSYMSITSGSQRVKKKVVKRSLGFRLSNVDRVSRDSLNVLDVKCGSAPSGRSVNSIRRRLLSTDIARKKNSQMIKQFCRT